MRTVKYSVTPRKNLLKPAEPAKFYANIQATGEKGLDELCEDINGTCTFTRADIVGALAAIEVEAIKTLQNGHILRIGDLGSLRVSVSSNGAETEKDFNESYIKSARLVYTPSVKLREMLSKLQYVQVDKLPVKESKSKNEPEN